MAAKFFLVVIIFLIVVSSYLSADPFPVYIINEYQTAPDSLERIEFHQFPYIDTLNLYGWKIISRAGTSWVSDSIILDSGYAVIDSSNTFGVFDLGDEEDHIDIEGIIYDEKTYPDSDPAPPGGASVSLFFIWCGGLDPISYDQYIDTTPTFGEPNDDYAGCQVAGGVYGAEDSLPIAEANLNFRLSDIIIEACPAISLRTETQVLTDSTGAYQVDSLYPLGYEVSVETEGWKSQTTTVRVKGALDPTQVNFYLQGSGIQVEEIKPELKNGLVVWPNPFIKGVKIYSPEGTEILQIFDSSGRLLSELPAQDLVKWSGRDLLGRDLPPGTYFIKSTAAESKVKKLIKFR